VIELKRYRLDVHLCGNELEQEAKCIAVTREGLGTDVSMRQQMLDEEFLKQWPNEGVRVLHDQSPRTANAEKRSDALPNSSGIAER
jgi:hypothetical protein